MTPSKAHRINGLQYEKRGKWWYAIDAETMETIGTREVKRDDKTALKYLVEDIYAVNRQKTMHRDGFKCVWCGGFRNLECDHIEARSKGRDDRTSNLRTLCSLCHRKRHGQNVVGW